MEYQAHLLAYERIRSIEDNVEDQNQDTEIQLS